jgi:hypothetical protein
MSKLQVAEQEYSNFGLMFTSELPVAAWANALYPSATDPHDPAGDVKQPVVAAYVNRGRWCARCPWCGSAQVVSETDHRFFCVGHEGCMNQLAGYKFIPVKWPKAAREIEAVLCKRPRFAQNWLPSESLEDLIAENAENGVM